MKGLRDESNIFYIKEITVCAIDGIDTFFIEIHDIESEKNLACLSDDVFLLFTVDEYRIDIGHDSLSVDVMLFLRGLRLLIYDLLEVT